MELKLDRAKLVLEDGGFALPRMVPVRQTFAAEGVRPEAVPALVAAQFRRDDIRARVQPGMRVAVGVGSRGIDNLAAIVRCTVAELRRLGAEPFLVPAMGSHGGGTADGQERVLAGYGITEANVGAPIRSSMETVYLGNVLGDVEVHTDRLAAEADGVVVISRIKPHTDFKAPIESGVCKMLAIGLGKHKGASCLHRGGMDDFDKLLPAAARLVMEKTGFLFGVGLVEDAYHRTAIVECLTPEQLPAREEELLRRAKAMMPRLLLPRIDVLVVDELGKNISGCGMDPNVIGRTGTPSAQGRFTDAPPIRKLAVLGLTEETEGNAVGIGLADYTTARVIGQIDFAKMYTNTLTAIEVGQCKLPLIMSDDEEAVRVAAYTAGRRDFGQVGIVRIRNTLALDIIFVSENVLPAALRHPSLEVCGPPRAWRFDASGRLAPGDWEEAAGSGPA